MTTSTKRAIIAGIIEYAANKKLTLRDGYRGRTGCEGRCLGVVTPDTDATLAEIDSFLGSRYSVSRADREKVLIEGSRRDVFTFEYVLYWPDLTAEATA